MVFSLVAVYGLKITAISQKYCTTTWQIGFNIFIFVLDSTHSTKPHLFLFCFESKGRIFQINLSTDFLRGMKNVTLDNFRYFFFMERCFYLLLCNLFHKAAFMNFMFPKRCPITLLGPKCKTSLVITLNIQFLERCFRWLLHVICVTNAVSQVSMFPRNCSETLLKLEFKMLLTDR